MRAHGERAAIRALVGLRRRACYAFAMILALPSVLAAADGVIEINAVRAALGDVTPGDAAGYPVTITLPGSYRLTGDLDLRGEPSPANVTAIRIESNAVTFDLAGFSIVGPTVGCPDNCSPLGTGIGIEALGSVTIRNGTLRGLGSDGVLLQGIGLVRDVVATGNRLYGVHANEHSLLLDVIANENGAGGIVAFSPALLRRVTASNNRINGALFVDGGLALDMLLLDNGDTGLSRPSGSTSRIVFGRALLRRNAGGDGNDQIPAGSFLQVAANICGTDEFCP